MPRKNILYGLTGLVAVIMGFISKSVYRDIILSNHIYDYGIAGWLPSYFYVAGFSLLLMMRPVRFPVIIISVVTTASLLFELKQYGSTGVIDIKDAVASLAGGLTAILSMKIIDCKTK